MALIVLFVKCVAYADVSSDNGKIQIVSDELIYDSEQGCAEFIGRVKAVREDVVITADNLKIFYSNNEKISSLDQKAIEKITATGNVIIKFDNKVAFTDQAIYTMKIEQLVLIGDNSKVVSGKNHISGSKITLYKADGRIAVESGNNKRVQAIFFSKETDM